MNLDIMSRYSRKLAIRLGCAVLLFAVLATFLGIMVRYRQSLLNAYEHHLAIRKNVTEMRETRERIATSVTRFKGMLPVGYDSRTPEWLMFSRLDQVKNRFPKGELSVKPIEKKEDGSLALNFSLKLIHPEYNRVINTIGELETEVFPFVTFTGIDGQQVVDGLGKAFGVTVTGSIVMPGTGETTGEPPPPDGKGAP